MSDMPLGVYITIGLISGLLIFAIAEGLSRQRDMMSLIKQVMGSQEKLSESQKQTRDAIKSVANKSGQRLAHIEGQLDVLLPSRPADKPKSPELWEVDSNFSTGVNSNGNDLRANALFDSASPALWEVDSNFSTGVNSNGNDAS